MTLNGKHAGNAGGVIINGAGQDIALWAFSYRAANNLIYLSKMGGGQNVTLTGSISTDGTITITASASTQMTAIYFGEI